jgi:predicted AAA+ superfamily ATPase
MGAVAENAVSLRLRQGSDVSFYHEGNKEVDFVQGDTAYEVKFKASPSPEDLHALVDAPFKRRVLITRRPYKDERVENETLTSFLA